MSSRRSRFGVIFLTVFVDLAGFGIILPVIPYYAQSFGAGGLGFGALIGVFSLMQFVATMVLGRLSDRTGRRPMLLVTMLVGAVGYLTFAAAESYLVLFLARMIAGFAAGNLSVAQAYIADITNPGERSRGMGLIGAALGLGFIVGPALGGMAAHIGGPSAAGYTAAALCLLNFTMAFSLLRESLREEHRTHRPLLDSEHLVKGFSDSKLAPLFTVFGLVPFAFSGFMVAFPLFAGAEFAWTERELALYFTMIGVVAASVQGYFFGRLSDLFGDRNLIIVGMLCLAVPLAVTPFASSAYMLYAVGVVVAFGNSIAGPALTGMISNLSDPSEQGAMLGAAHAVSALGRLSGPFVFGTLYDSVAPTAAFLGAASVMLAAWLVVVRVRSSEETAPATDPGR
jgi:MFS family permease